MSLVRTAVYAGSFDPFTIGHLDVACRALSLFDQLVIAIGENPGKRYLLSVEQRSFVIEDATKHLSGVRVDRFSGLLVDYCHRIGACAIVRGLRSGRDLDFESPIAMANQKMHPEIQTIFLLSDPNHCFVSSSIVREIATYGGDIAPYVTPEAKALIVETLHQRRLQGE